MVPTTMLLALLLLAGRSAWAQRVVGGSGDPMVEPVGDPHGAISAMSRASEPQQHKSDHPVTVPDLVPSTNGSPASGKR